MHNYFIMTARTNSHINGSYKKILLNHSQNVPLSLKGEGRSYGEKKRTDIYFKAIFYWDTSQYVESIYVGVMKS